LAHTSLARGLARGSFSNPRFHNSTPTKSWVKRLLPQSVDFVIEDDGAGHKTCVRTTCDHAESFHVAAAAVPPATRSIVSVQTDDIRVALNAAANVIAGVGQKGGAL
jgi:hypothetical protein